MNQTSHARSPGPVVLVMGASGLLGPYLMNAVATIGTALGLSRKGPDVTCDLLEFEGVRNWLQKNRPPVVIYAAALTDVDLCERESALADALHHRAVANVVAALTDDVKLVYISTDQVYPDTQGPHNEEQTGPVNVYGKSKLAGELAALEHRNTLVLRANLFGPSLTPGRNSLSDFMLDRFRKGAEISLFNDVLFSPLHMQTLSDVLIELVSNDVRGVFNLGCREGMSKMEFGYAIARHFDLDVAKAREVACATLPGRVQRINDMRMDVGKLEAILGRKLPTLLEEVSKL